MARRRKREGERGLGVAVDAEIVRNRLWARPKPGLLGARA